MGRKPSVNLNLPSGMRARKWASGKTWYYLEHGKDVNGKRHWEPLGDDFPEALRKYADRVKTATAPAVTVPEMLLAWQQATLHEHAPRTQRDIAANIRQLIGFFGNPPAPLHAVEPHHIRQYLEWRTAKVQANREVAWFSAAWNWARGAGRTKLTNPAMGVKRNKEKGRDLYIEDDELAAIMSCADAPLREALELGYLIGQRPGDLRKIKVTDIRDGFLVLQQDKTAAKVRIEVSGHLAELVGRIATRKRGIPGVVSPALLVKENGERLSREALRYRFDKARDAAAAAYPQISGRIRKIQFRDLRAKAASDVENLYRAQRLLGHTSQTMTEHYVRKRRGEKVMPVK